MQTDELIAAIDAAITSLQHARSTLTVTPVKRGPGRPRKTVAAPVTQTRRHSDETRARMAAAQKKRWAKAKRASKNADK